MSILISGVSLPKNGLDRKISISEDGCVRYYGGSSVIGRAVELPPHGRLLDEEQILRLINEQRQDEYNRTHSPKMMWSDVVNAFEWLLQWVDTIIPADPKEDEE